MKLLITVHVESLDDGSVSDSATMIVDGAEAERIARDHRELGLKHADVLLLALAAYTRELKR